MKQSTLPASERILLVASLLWFSVLAGAQTQPDNTCLHPPHLSRCRGIYSLSVSLTGIRGRHGYLTATFSPLPLGNS